MENDEFYVCHFAHLIIKGIICCYRGCIRILCKYTQTLFVESIYCNKIPALLNKEGPAWLFSATEYQTSSGINETGTLAQSVFRPINGCLISCCDRSVSPNCSIVSCYIEIVSIFALSLYAMLF